ncbi:MAG: hypothetical protein KDK40_05595, partial [Chlamydiia bacterium]|nr:hypothetical protein [Chlamydiia bacterium]
MSDPLFNLDMSGSAGSSGTPYSVSAPITVPPRNQHLLSDLEFEDVPMDNLEDVPMDKPTGVFKRNLPSTLGGKGGEIELHGDWTDLRPKSPIPTVNQVEGYSKSFEGAHFVDWCPNDSDLGNLGEESPYMSSTPLDRSASSIIALTQTVTAVQIPVIPPNEDSDTRLGVKTFFDTTTTSVFKLARHAFVLGKIQLIAQQRGLLIDKTYPHLDRAVERVVKSVIDWFLVPKAIKGFQEGVEDKFNEYCEGLERFGGEDTGRQLALKELARKFWVDRGDEQTFRIEFSTVVRAMPKETWRPLGELCCFLAEYPPSEIQKRDLRFLKLFENVIEGVIGLVENLLDEKQRMGLPVSQVIVTPVYHRASKNYPENSIGKLMKGLIDQLMAQVTLALDRSDEWAEDVYRRLELEGDPKVWHGRLRPLAEALLPRLRGTLFDCAHRLVDIFLQQDRVVLIEQILLVLRNHSQAYHSARKRGEFAPFTHSKAFVERYHKFGLNLRYGLHRELWDDKAEPGCGAALSRVITDELIPKLVRLLGENELKKILTENLTSELDLYLRALRAASKGKSEKVESIIISALLKFVWGEL